MSASEEARIEAMFASLAAAWRDRDIDRWGAHFTPDSDFITWRGVWWRSREENLAGHRSAPDAVLDQFPAYELTTEGIDLLSPTVALVHARWIWHQFIDGDAAAEDRCGLLTHVLVKIDDQWRIRALQNTRAPCQSSG